ncbi:MAG: hypothetical protein GY811_13010 [Myxococcales bacterium]|nr:hypothetical protein [Myxococcales bacterium]
MRCKEAKAKSSAYLDGDLNDEETAAVRGHLRQCAGCEGLFEQESALLALVANLEPLDPPHNVWEGISKTIAEAEIADSERSAGWRWLASQYRALGVAGACLCTAAVLTFYLGTGELGADESLNVPTAGVARQGAEAVPLAPESVAQVRYKALSEADMAYHQTIEELRDMLAEDRSSWSDPVTAAVDAKLVGFRRAAIEQRLAIGDSSSLIASRDPIYATYRAEISFLQSALAGELLVAEGSP